MEATVAFFKALFKHLDEITEKITQSLGEDSWW
jgi:hypothetical protein